MRKEYGQPIKKELSKLLGSLPIVFEEFKGKSVFIASGEKVYTHQCPGITLFIVFEPQGNGRDAFTFQIGWSTKDRFPELRMRPCLETPNEVNSEFAKDEYLCRLHSLTKSKDNWWVIPKGSDGISYAVTIDKKKAAEDALIVLDDAYRALKTLGIPYLEKRAKE